MMPFRLEFSLVPNGHSPIEGKIGPHIMASLFDALYYVSVYVANRLQSLDEDQRFKAKQSMLDAGLSDSQASVILTGCTRITLRSVLCGMKDTSILIAWISHYFAQGEDDMIGYLCLTPSTLVYTAQ